MAASDPFDVIGTGRGADRGTLRDLRVSVDEVCEELHAIGDLQAATPVLASAYGVHALEPAFDRLWVAVLDELLSRSREWAPTLEVFCRLLGLADVRRVRIDCFRAYRDGLRAKAEVVLSSQVTAAQLDEAADDLWLDCSVSACATALARDPLGSWQRMTGLNVQTYDEQVRDTYGIALADACAKLTDAHWRLVAASVVRPDWARKAVRRDGRGQVSDHARRRGSASETLKRLLKTEVFGDTNVKPKRPKLENYAPGVYGYDGVFRAEVQQPSQMSPDDPDSNWYLALGEDGTDDILGPFATKREAVDELAALIAAESA